jgi:hypothetical protein
MDNPSLKISQIKNCRYYCLMLVICSLFSCVGYSLTGGPGPLVQDDLTTESGVSFRPSSINVVSIMPLERGLTSVLSEQELTNYNASLVKAFEQNTSLEITNLSNQSVTEKAIEEIWTQHLPREQRAKRIAAVTRAEGVVHGVVSKNESGELSFRLWMIDVKSNSVAWQAVYGLSNQALSDNIFQARESLKRGLLKKQGVGAIEKAMADAARNFESINLN